MYKILIARRAEKNLAKIPTRYVERIRAKIAQLAIDPYIGKRLEAEYKNDYSIRVWPYRIIYTIRNKELIVEVIEITLSLVALLAGHSLDEGWAKWEHRQSAYKQ
jgi:mRNA-degrading endonuclease RelE of RelBE toxin-antitoxin system